MNIKHTQTTDLYTLNGLIVWYENYLSQSCAPRGRENRGASMWTTCCRNPRMPCSTVFCVFIINNVSMPVTSSESVLLLLSLKLKEIKIICPVTWLVEDSAWPVTAALLPLRPNSYQQLLLFLLSHVRLCPRTIACPASLSFTISQSLLKHVH